MMMNLYSVGHVARIVCLVALCCPLDTRATAQGRARLFDGASLENWSVELTKAEVRDGALQILEKGGWVRTNQPYADFKLGLDVRFPPGAAGAVIVRSWPSFSSKDAFPTDGYELRLGSAPGALAASVAWEHLDIECTGTSVRVRMNDVLVVDRSGVLKNPQGYIAFASYGGVLEFRDVSVEWLPWPSPIAPAGVYSPKQGIEMPKLVREVRPKYPRKAATRRIEGTMVLSAIVQADGSVSDVNVLKSLDPASGLDEEGIKALKQWRFEAGKRDGQPVPVQITTEMSFRIKR